MTRYVIDPAAALRLVSEAAVVADGHQLLAPTLLRSQVLSRLYREVREGRLTREDADARLDAVRGLRIRLLGDRVLQRVAWRIAAERDLPDTLDAEYVALTRLQADALVALDPGVAAAAGGVVPVAPWEALF